MNLKSVDCIEKKSTIIKVLRNHGVKKASFFGSVARGKAKKDSDIDLLIEFEGRRSLLDLAGLKIELEELLDRKVDVLTYKSLHPSSKTEYWKKSMYSFEIY